MAPPPPSGVPPPPAPPPPPPPAPTLPHAKPASLLDEIHKGRDLHHVEPEAPAPVDGRNALLSDIREGIALKAVCGGWSVGERGLECWKGGCLLG